MQTTELVERRGDRTRTGVGIAEFDPMEAEIRLRLAQRLFEVGVERAASEHHRNRAFLRQG